MKKLHIKTWGCQMNEYDSSKIIDLLINNYHYYLTQNAEEADVLLLNTCSIREKAQEKIFHQLGRWKILKKNNPNLVIGVGGCVAAQEGSAILKRADYVDIIFGPQTIHKLPDMINKVYHRKDKVIDISFPQLEKFNFFPDPSSNNYKACVSIMEGCNKYCTFCVVPYTRGEEFSRPCDDVIFEIAQLADQGVREINLLGQNVNAYRGVTFDGKICKFSELLRLVAAIDGIDRIRFTTSHPSEFTDDIINVYYDTPELVSFVHLPIQSGSDRILKLMNRPYTVDKYKDIINKLRKVRPDIQISSDFIIGFPGETTKDFYLTIKLINDINFDMSFSFIYSPRPGTPASYLPDNVSIHEKKNRLKFLQKIINKQARSWTKRMIGTKQKILVEGISKKNIMNLYGRTENNRIIYFEGLPTMIGKFVTIKIVDYYNNLLQGLVENID